jgi:(p)ppGpp synthase/HD superfamily hydrolase
MEAGLSAFTEKIAVYEARDQARILRALHGENAPGSPDAARLGRALEIAAILISLNLDADTLIAALILNRDPEAAAPSAAPGPVAEQFGPRIALLVEGAAKMSGLQAKNKTIREAANIRKMLFAMA